MKITLIGLLILLSACAASPTMQELHASCEKKYGVPLPEGATPAKPMTQIAVRPQGGRRMVYACVLASVDEGGAVTGVRLLETDDAEFSDHLIGVVKRTKFYPASLNGKPVTQQFVVTAGIN